MPLPSEISSIAKSPQVIAMPRTIAQDPISTGLMGHSVGATSSSTPPIRALGARSANRAGDRSNLARRIRGCRPRSQRDGGHVPEMRVTPSDSRRQVKDPSVLSEVHKVEEATVHYAPTSVDFLQNLRAQDEAGQRRRYVSAILLEEKSVWDYNQGNPRGSGDPGRNPPPDDAARRVLPGRWCLVADHPYAILHSPWVSADQATAAQFRDFFSSPKQQERFQELGYRDADGGRGQRSPRRTALPHEAHATMPPPDGDVLQKIRNKWPKYRKRARMLILMDVSARCSAPRSPLEEKLALAQAAARAIGQLGRPRGRPVDVLRSAPTSSPTSPIPRSNRLCG